MEFPDENGSVELEGDAGVGVTRGTASPSRSDTHAATKDTTVA